MTKQDFYIDSAAREDLEAKPQNVKINSSPSSSMLSATEEFKALAQMQDGKGKASSRDIWKDIKKFSVKLQAEAGAKAWLCQSATNAGTHNN